MQSKLVIFLLLSAVLYVLSVFFGRDLQTQMMMALPWILFLGIPHGAVDHILYKEASTLSLPVFYVFYLLSIFVYAALWFWIPQVALVLFLILSAFHFGQSQFGGYTSIPVFYRVLTSFFWGVLILAALLSFHTEELKEITLQGTDVSVLENVLLSNVYQALFLVSLPIVAVLFFLSYRRSWWTSRVALRESLCLFSILLVFYFLPLLIAFACYFCILHSLRMLEDEFGLLKETGIVYTVFDFMIKLLPMTILSFCGLTIFVLAILEGWLEISFAFLSIVMIALITLPHSVVMHSLYNRNSFVSDQMD